MRKILTTFFYELKFALNSMARHLLLSLSAISAIMVSLLLCSMLLIMEFHIDRFVDSLSSQTAIHVILNENLASSEKKRLQSEISAIVGVTEVEYSSRDNELELLIKEKGDAFAMYRGENNPLSDAFFVQVSDQNELETISEEIRGLPGVSESAYGGSSTARFLGMLTKIRIFSWVIVALLLLLSLYLIYNTIKSTIDSRKTEIQIMRQVGATNTFIRVPFELEGIIIGLAGAVIPYLIVYFGYRSLYQMLGGRLYARVFSLISPDQMAGVMAAFLFGAGLLLGAAASLMAVNKYIKETR